MSEQQEPLNRQSANIPHWYSAKSEVPPSPTRAMAHVRDDDRILGAMSEQAQRVPYVSPSKNNDA